MQPLLFDFIFAVLRLAIDVSHEIATRCNCENALLRRRQLENGEIFSKMLLIDRHFRDSLGNSKK